MNLHLSDLDLIENHLQLEKLVNSGDMMIYQVLEKYLHCHHIQEKRFVDFHQHCTEFLHH
jgi:hypothetical protein